MLQAELGEALRTTGDYAEAGQAYEAALAIVGDLHDLHGQAFAQGRLGDLALMEGQLEEALMRYRAALVLFQQIREPARRQSPGINSAWSFISSANGMRLSVTTRRRPGSGKRPATGPAPPSSGANSLCLARRLVGPKPRSAGSAR